MTIRRFGRAWLGLVWWMCGCWPAGIAQGKPLEVFEGVKLEIEPRSKPRPLTLHWLEADLKRPGVKVAFLPSNGERPGEIDAGKPTERLESQGWQAIINGDAFSLLNSEGHYAGSGTPLDLQGAAAFEGVFFSQPVKQYAVFYQLRDGNFGFAYPPLPKPIRNAIGGYRIVLRGSKIPSGLKSPLHPRTAVGLDAKKQRMIWLVVDGRQPGRSEGATEEELGLWMRMRGASDALSLDGGGSSLMAIRQGKEVRVINRPVGVLNIPGSIRPVGNCLGLCAPPLQTPGLAAP
jgi:hypothetical protein